MEDWTRAQAMKNLRHLLPRKPNHDHDHDPGGARQRHQKKVQRKKT
jgi:hypothetical protein